jgi:hypothetical protein
MSKKGEHPGQYEFHFSASPVVDISTPKPRTEEDLPKLSSTVSAAVRERYEREASSRGVDVRVLKYAIDTYGQDFELFLEAYSSNGSLDAADSIMRMSEA